VDFAFIPRHEATQIHLNCVIKNLPIIIAICDATLDFTIFFT